MSKNNLNRNPKVSNGVKTSNSIKVGIPYATLINAVRQMRKKDRESFLEDLLALTSPKYLESIREARANYKVGRVKTHQDLFGKRK